MTPEHVSFTLVYSTLTQGNCTLIKFTLGILILTCKVLDSPRLNLPRVILPWVILCTLGNYTLVNLGNFTLTLEQGILRTSTPLNGLGLRT